MSMLAIQWDVNPEIISLGKLGIRYYSLFFIIAFTIGYFLFKYFFKREEVPLKLLDPLLYTLVLCTLVGARLGHCLFYQPQYYLANPIEILYVWEGGLASHGGAIALLLGMWWFAHHYGANISSVFVDYGQAGNYRGTCRFFHSYGQPDEFRDLWKSHRFAVGVCVCA